MIYHAENSFWLISEHVEFILWYLRELEYCVTRGHRMRRAVGSRPYGQGGDLKNGETPQALLEIL